MPLNKNMSHEEKVKELMNAYKAKGKIGNTEPKSEEEALKIANAIAYNNENLDFKAVEGMKMEEKLDKLKAILKENFKVDESLATSQTRYDEEAKEKSGDSLKPETDKTYEEDRLDLEEILNQSTNYKKNYVKRVVNTINKLIDGTADLDDLKVAVKGKRKKSCK